LLPPETERLWEFVRQQPALSGFVLIGGSALALRIHHRLSEDLDLVWLEQRLPRARLEVFLNNAFAAGFDVKRHDDEAALHEFADSTLELHDYQQDFLANGKTRISFFTPEPPLKRILAWSKDTETGARIASLAELFKAKCLVSALRSKTRDWVDLYLLMRHHGFGLGDYRAAFIEAGVPDEFEIGLGLLCSGIPQKDDEGYAHLLPNPPTVEEIASFFKAERDRLEIDLAKGKHKPNA